MKDKVVFFFFFGALKNLVDMLIRRKNIQDLHPIPNKPCVQNQHKRLQVELCFHDMGLSGRALVRTFWHDGKEGTRPQPVLVYTVEL